MRPSCALCAPILACALALVGVSAAGTDEQRFTPTVGQEGKDVIWVPTPAELVEKMLDMARLTPEDYLLDLGSGDGRMVIAAAERGARARGVEYNQDMVNVSRINALQAGLGHRAEFVRGDLLKTDLSRATVITMFLLPDLNLKLRSRILALKPGTRVVSNTFTMGDWWADETATVGEPCRRWCTALLWIVPAAVEGTWRSSRGDLRLTQEYQLISGTMTSGGSPVAINSGLLRGDQIRFTVGDARYSGRVIGDIVEGTVSAGGTTEKWKAKRAD